MILNSIFVFFINISPLLRQNLEAMEFKEMHSSLFVSSFRRLPDSVESEYIISYVYIKTSQPPDFFYLRSSAVDFSYVDACSAMVLR